MTRVNHRIRAREVRVVHGEKNVVMDTREAIKLAKNAGMDLVEIAGNATPPVCRIIEYGKYKYELSKKKKASEELIHGVEPHRPKRGEPYMGDVQSDHFRQILNSWKQELVEDIDRTMSVMQDDTINLPDPNDRATLETDRSLELRTRDRERKLIKKINDSLIDLDKGDYGYCEDCGVEIGIKRLEARPTANLCIDCKSLNEIREKQNA